MNSHESSKKRNALEFKKKTQKDSIQSSKKCSHIIGFSGLVPGLNNSGRHIHLTLKSCHLIFCGKEIIIFFIFYFFSGVGME